MPRELTAAVRLFCSDTEMENLLVRAHNIKAPRLSVSAGFELRVGWLLGLFGSMTTLIEEPTQKDCSLPVASFRSDAEALRPKSCHRECALSYPFSGRPIV